MTNKNNCSSTKIVYYQNEKVSALTVVDADFLEDFVADLSFPLPVIEPLANHQINMD